MQFEVRTDLSHPLEVYEVNINMSTYKFYIIFHSNFKNFILSVLFSRELSSALTRI